MRYKRRSAEKGLNGMRENEVSVQARDVAVAYRPARRGECRTIAALYSISSDGIADYR